MWSNLSARVFALSLSVEQCVRLGLRARSLIMSEPLRDF